VDGNKPGVCLRKDASEKNGGELRENSVGRREVVFSAE
jgi:hypothetical protein